MCLHVTRVCQMRMAYTSKSTHGTGNHCVCMDLHVSARRSWISTVNRQVRTFRNQQPELYRQMRCNALDEYKDKFTYKLGMEPS